MREIPESNEHTNSKEMNINVAVRLRPLSAEEKRAGSDCAVSMDKNTTTVHTFTAGQKCEKTFTLDKSYWSCSMNDEDYASQETIMKGIGEPLCENAYRGYNGCLFAYGQTGSGKSYSIMGNPSEAGVLPRVLRNVFDRKSQVESDDTVFRVWLSFVEIYNEQIRDLLHPGHDVQEPKLVDHPILGVTLPLCPCETLDDALKLIAYATKKRVVGSTNMNSASSRSHAVCTVRVTTEEDARKTEVNGRPPTGRQTVKKVKESAGDKPKIASRAEPMPAMSASIQFVDLAGSERVSKTAAHLKMQHCVNHSLAALARIVQQLSAGTDKSKIAFLSSKLTFLMRGSLAGNSRTSMIAAIGPARDNIDETLSTLRFAVCVRKIQTTAKVNVERKDEVVASLQREIKRLKAQAWQPSDEEVPADIAALKGELEEASKQREELLATVKKTYAERVEVEETMNVRRENTLHQIGLSSEAMGTLNVAQVPYLVNVSDDPLLTGCLLFQLHTGSNTVGKDMSNNITLKGLGMRSTMCTLRNNNNKEVILLPSDKQIDDEAEGGDEDDPAVACRIYVNGERTRKRRVLAHMDKICFGKACILRFCLPDSRRPLPCLDDIHDTNMFSELTVADSGQYRELRVYLQDIKNRLDKPQAERVLNKLADLSKLVDEANEITAEVRPQDGFRFQVELVWDVDIAYTAAEDMIVLRVLQYGGEAPNCLYYWTVPKFRERLEGMRQKYDEIYHKLTTSRSSPRAVRCEEGESEIFDGAYDTARDPWLEPSMADVAQAIYLSNHEATLTETAIEALKTLEIDTKAPPKILTQHNGTSVTALRKSPTARNSPKMMPEVPLSQRTTPMNGQSQPRIQTLRDRDSARKGNKSKETFLNDVIETLKGRIEDKDAKLRLKDEIIAEFEQRNVLAQGLRGNGAQQDRRDSTEGEGPLLQRAATANFRDQAPRPLLGTLTSPATTGRQMSFSNLGLPMATLRPYGEKRMQSPLASQHPRQGALASGTARCMSRGRLAPSTAPTAELADPGPKICTTPFMPYPWQVSPAVPSRPLSPKAETREGLTNAPPQQQLMANHIGRLDCKIPQVTQEFAPWPTQTRTDTAVPVDPRVAPPSRVLSLGSPMVASVRPFLTASMQYAPSSRTASTTK